uniref:E2F-associated phosphoprotein n=1 Tax=Cannabis sativa TaxID=3483 RepID=A0A803Q790_CANSA
MSDTGERKSQGDLELESDKRDTTMDSPVQFSESSDDDEIDYSVKPELYDPELDDKDELWVQKKRKGRHSDAVLSCPACFTTLSLDCQRHEKYLTQYRAIFVVNCKVGSKCLLRDSISQLKSGKRRRETDESEVDQTVGETFKQVHCMVCSTEVGVMDEEEVYHFFNVLPSES